jgi:hypothetical protein
VLGRTKDFATLLLVFVSVPHYNVATTADKSLIPAFLDI